jgi:hypothetical protein
MKLIRNYMTNTYTRMNFSKDNQNQICNYKNIKIKNNYGIHLIHKDNLRAVC